MNHLSLSLSISILLVFLIFNFKLVRKFVLCNFNKISYTQSWKIIGIISSIWVIFFISLINHEVYRLFIILLLFVWLFSKIFLSYTGISTDTFLTKQYLRETCSLLLLNSTLLLFILYIPKGSKESISTIVIYFITSLILFISEIKEDSHHQYVEDLNQEEISLSRLTHKIMMYTQCYVISYFVVLNLNHELVFLCLPLTFLLSLFVQKLKSNIHLMNFKNIKDLINSILVIYMLVATGLMINAN